MLSEWITVYLVSVKTLFFLNSQVKGESIYTFIVTSVWTVTDKAQKATWTQDLPHVSAPLLQRQQVTPMIQPHVILCYVTRTLIKTGAFLFNELQLTSRCHGSDYLV